MIKELTPREFLERRAGGAELTLLDVREDWETALAPVPADHLHIPMGQIADRLGELNPAQETVVICRSGGRSLNWCQFVGAFEIDLAVDNRRRRTTLERLPVERRIPALGE